MRYLHACLFIVLWAPTLGYSEVYQWTDATGTVHFSDKPQAGAMIVKLKTNEISVAIPTPKTANATTTDSIMEPMPEKPHVYQSIKLAEPQDQASFWNTDSQFNIIIALEPSLMAEDKVQLLVDGKPNGQPQSSAILQASQIERGAHQLQVQVLDASGQVLISSSAITIYMHQATVRQHQR